MADVTTTNYADALYNFRVAMQKNYRKRHVLISQLKRVAPQEVFSGGDEARIPIILNSLQGGGNPGESGTINVPHSFNLDKATFTLENVVMPIGITLNAEENSNVNSAAPALRTLVEECENALSEIVNDQFNCPGALLASVSANTTSPSLTVYTNAALTNYDRLRAGRVVDILTRSSGANPGNGLRRKIDSVDEATGIITFATAAQASDGDSGNITFSNTAGLYLPGTWGNALQSLHDIASTSGTFEGIVRSSVQGWQAIDGRNGDTDTKMLSDVLMDSAVRRGRRTGGFAWEFAMGEPSVIDGYKQSKYAQTRVNPQMKTLSGGFAGIEYVHAGGTIAMIAEDRFERGKLVLVPTEDIAVYHGPGNPSGPEWIKDTGGQWQRFARTLTKEAWWRDNLQLAAKRCNRVVFLDDLDEAA
jgi:hypothetical protein